MRRRSAWLRLVRVAALPTALADVWLGAALVGRLRSPELLAVSGVSLALYAAGMILNDVHDLAWDREHNPTRPLPAGQVSRSAAVAVGLALLLLAVAGAALIGRRPLLVAASIAVAVLGYDLVLKGGAVGPVNMAVCRGLNVVLGLAIGAPGRLLFHLPAAGAVFVYVAGVTWLARWEAGRRRRRPVAVASVGIVLSAVLVVLLQHRAVRAAFGRQLAPSAGPLVFLQVVFGLLLAVVLWAVLRAVWSARDVRTIVRGLLRGIVPLQALVALAHFRVLGMVCILGLLLPLLLLRKQSHVT
ncbi:MAG: UbiA family prenyltransferase [bacterium]